MSASSELPDLRVVIDTNLFVSGLIAREDRPPAVLIDAVMAGRFTLVTSVDLDVELSEVLARPKLKDRYAIDSTLR